MTKCFWQSEDGAITTDWVVMAAAVVGLGVTSVTAVRTGSNALATDVETSLGGASVALLGDTCAGGPSTSTYKTQVLSEKNQQNQADWLAKAGDESVTNSFGDVSAKMDWYQANDPKNTEVIAELVDHAAMIGAEIEKRGMDYPKETGDFAALHERAYGPANTTLCNTGPADTSSQDGRSMLMMDTYENGEVLQKYAQELQNYEIDKLLAFAAESATLAKQAIGEGDKKSAGYQLDLMALSLNTAEGHEKQPDELVKYAETYDQLRADYDATFPTK